MLRTCVLAMAMVVVAVVGCNNDSDGIARYPVKGRVSVQGTPLAHATVVFENADLGVAQSAATDSNGNFEFTTYNTKGLPAGTYKVVVTPGRVMRPGEEIPLVDPNAPPRPAAPPAANVPEKYTAAQTSDLIAEVQAGDNAPFQFDLEP